MLTFIGSRRQTYVLRTMQRDERMPKWTCHTYDWLFRSWRLPPATYIFTGVDRLDPGERRLAAQFYRHINAQGEGFRAMNDPAIGMGRYRLLRTLHERGINTFNAYLATERERPTRYPVFLRRNSASIKPLSDLLHSADEVEAAIASLIAAGEVAEDLLIIEYCAEEMAPGIFAKYSQFQVGTRSFPNAMLFSGGWFVKLGTQIEVPDELYHHDARNIETNPYAAQMARVFEIAGIEYGRADFGIVGGRVEVFEVNYNPTLTTQREKPRDNLLQRANRARVDDITFEAMHTIDSHGGKSAPTIWNDELNQFRLRWWRNYAPQRY
jgi:hypothetical protein